MTHIRTTAGSGASYCSGACVPQVATASAVSTTARSSRAGAARRMAACGPQRSRGSCSEEGRWLELCSPSQGAVERRRPTRQPSALDALSCPVLDAVQRTCSTAPAGLCARVANTRRPRPETRPRRCAAYVRCPGGLAAPRRAAPLVRAGAAPALRRGGVRRGAAAAACGSARGAGCQAALARALGAGLFGASARSSGA